MSFSPNNYLNADPVEHFRCQQHAARTFVDEQFRLLPKNKFLYHVAFNVNWQVLNSKNVSYKMIETLKDEINLLVKSTDLPAYTVQNDVLNQYNRKKVVQYQHKYNEIAMSFHDDNMGLVNQLWQAYYKYYYADPTVADTRGAYNKTAMQASSAIKVPYGYTGRIKPFFNYITIYQMARHEYVSYKLVNPIITSWNGNRLAYSDGGSHHFDFKLSFESVYYDIGYVDSGNMEGFGTMHYDWTPSSITSKWPRNISSAPSFPNTTFGGTDKGVVYSDNMPTKNSQGTLNPLLYQQVINNASPGVQGVTIPQSNVTTDKTVATPVSVNTVTEPVTVNTETTVTPDYTNNL